MSRQANKEVFPQKLYIALRTKFKSLKKKEQSSVILFLFHPPVSALTTPISRSIYVPVSPNLQFLKQDTLSLASKLCQMLFLLLGTLPMPTFSLIVLEPSGPGSDISPPRKIFPGAPPPLVWGRPHSDESQPLSEPLHPGFITSFHNDLDYKIIHLFHWTEAPPGGDCACLGHCLISGSKHNTWHTVCSTHICQVALSLQTNFDHIIGRLDFFGGSGGKESAGNTGDQGLISGSGRSPGEGNGYPLQYSCLENLTDKEPGGLQSMGLQRVGHD